MFKVSLANKRDKQTRKIHGKRRKIAVVNSFMYSNYYALL